MGKRLMSKELLQVIGHFRKRLSSEQYLPYKYDDVNLIPNTQVRLWVWWNVPGETDSGHWSVGLANLWAPGELRVEVRAPVSAEAILWPLRAYLLAHTDMSTCTPRAKEQSWLVTLFHQLLEFLQQPMSYSQTGKEKVTWMFSDSILRFKRPHFPGWRDGPVLKSTCRSYRGFKLGLQYSYGNSQSSLTLIPG